MSDAIESEEFLFLGHHPAVDLVNTVRRGEQGLVDLLPDASALQAWGHAMGLADAGLQASDQDLAEAKQLRDAIRSLLTSWSRTETFDARALATLNRVLGWRQTAPTLTVSEGVIQWRAQELAESAEDLLLYLAEQAAELLVGGDPRRLKGCGGQDCVLLFWDTSRNLSRRWCSMATCGNRSKVSRHYHRHRAHEGPPNKST